MPSTTFPTLSPRNIAAGYSGADVVVESGRVRPVIPDSPPHGPVDPGFGTDQSIVRTLDPCGPVTAETLQVVHSLPGGNRPATWREALPVGLHIDIPECDPGFGGGRSESKMTGLGPTFLQNEPSLELGLRLLLRSVQPLAKRARF